VFTSFEKWTSVSPYREARQLRFGVDDLHQSAALLRAGPGASRAVQVDRIKTRVETAYGRIDKEKVRIEMGAGRVFQYFHFQLGFSNFVWFQSVSRVKLLRLSERRLALRGDINISLPPFKLG